MPCFACWPSCGIVRAALAGRRHQCAWRTWGEVSKSMKVSFASVWCARSRDLRILPFTLLLSFPGSVVACPDMGPEIYAKCLKLYDWMNKQVFYLLEYCSIVMLSHMFGSLTPCLPKWMMLTKMVGSRLASTRVYILFPIMGEDILYFLEPWSQSPPEHYHLVLSSECLSHSSRQS